MIHLTYTGHEYSESETRRLELAISREMMTKGNTRSASGVGAVLAVAWCRQHGYGYVMMESAGGGWFVQRGSKDG